MGLKWYEPLYTDEKTRNKIKSIQWRLNHGAGSFRLYLITLSTSPKMQLDIVPAAQLKQAVLRERLPMIVGVASGYADAEDLVIRMTEDVLLKTGRADIRGYFEKSAGGEA